MRHIARMSFAGNKFVDEICERTVTRTLVQTNWKINREVLSHSGKMQTVTDQRQAFYLEPYQMTRESSPSRHTEIKMKKSTSCE